jgi:hypothetical protein
MNRKYLGHLLLLLGICLQISFDFLRYGDGSIAWRAFFGSIFLYLLISYIWVSLFSLINRIFFSAFRFHEITGYSGIGFCLSTILLFGFDMLAFNHFSAAHVMEFYFFVTLICISINVGGMAHLRVGEDKPRWGFQVGLLVTLVAVGLIVAFEKMDSFRGFSGYSFDFSTKFSRFADRLPAENADDYIAKFFNPHARDAN